MFALLTALLLACSAAAQRPVLVNDMVDKQMAAHNAMLTKLGLGMTNISAGETNGVQFSKGIQLGLNTLKRTGDSYSIQTSKDKISYKYQVGYSLLLFAFGKITINGKDMSGYFRVKDNSMNFDFTVHNDGQNCEVILDEYKFSKFGDVLYETSESSSNNGVLSTDLKETLLNHVNEQIHNKKPGVEAHLQALCRPSSIPHGKPTITGPALAVTTEPPLAAKD
uniref:Uncharacterized protein n=1 Tax=Riptortus pedestris TaxID=329032 RepID=R4WCQ9_RIPPE|nr:unknown secreted protein [Riptortus pedestris]